MNKIYKRLLCYHVVYVRVLPAPAPVTQLAICSPSVAKSKVGNVVFVLYYTSYNAVRLALVTNSCCYRKPTCLQTEIQSLQLFRLLHGGRVYTCIIARIYAHTHAHKQISK